MTFAGISFNVSYTSVLISQKLCSAWALSCAPSATPRSAVLSATILLPRELLCLFAVPQPLKISTLQPLIHHNTTRLPSSPLLQSFRHPQNKNRTFWNGVRWNFVCTHPARPSILHHSSIYPQAKYTK